MKNKLTILGAFLFALTGCDAATNHVAQLAIDNEPTIVFSPGYKVSIAGQATPIFGFDDCPSGDPIMVKLFGEAPDVGSRNCIVLEKGRLSAKVQFKNSAGTVVTEAWQIVREQGKTAEGRPYSRISLKRPDGSLVIPVAN